MLPCAFCCLASSGVALGHPRLGAPGAALVAGGQSGESEVSSELLRHRVVPMTFVMHRFMHADDRRPGVGSARTGREERRPRIKETQERLLACSYAMAHPETGRLVPACVQHSVLDPVENRELAQLLPIPTPATSACARASGTSTSAS